MRKDIVERSARLWELPRGKQILLEELILDNIRHNRPIIKIIKSAGSLLCVSFEGHEYWMNQSVQVYVIGQIKYH